MGLASRLASEFVRKSKRLYIYQRCSSISPRKGGSVGGRMGHLVPVLVQCMAKDFGKNQEIFIFIAILRLGNESVDLF